MREPSLVNTCVDAECERKDSSACAIPDPDLQRVIISGGWYTRNTVSVYGVKGWIEDLQPLEQGREYHACASFLSAGERVKRPIYFNVSYSFLHFTSFSWLLEDEWCTSFRKIWVEGNHSG